MARYNYRTGFMGDKRRGRWLLVVVWVLVVAAALYIAALYLSPQLVTVPFTRLTATATDDQIKNSKAGQYGNRLFLPQINIAVSVAIGGGTPTAGSAWQRNASLGDPATKGNVVIGAPKFTLASTPQATRAESPFYNLGKINVGDQVTLDYRGVRYVYQIDRKFAVGQAQNVQQGSGDARLTLFATDSAGQTVAGTALSGKLISPVRAADSGNGFSASE